VRDESRTNSSGGSCDSLLLPTRRERHLVRTVSLIVSIAVGISSYLIKTDFQQSIILSVVIMLAFLVIESNSMVISLTHVTKVTNSRLEHLCLSFESLDQFMETRAQLCSSGGVDGVELTKTMDRIWFSFNDIPVVLLGLANKTLGESAEMLVRRNLVHAGQDPALGTNLVRWFQRSAFTTSLYPMDFWLTPWGQNYHRVICERMRKMSRTGTAMFRRVFIVQDEKGDELISGPYYELICEQIDSGVEIRSCFASDLSADLRIDFGVWDGVLEAFLIPDDTHRITTVHYRYSNDAIRAAEQRATLIWDRSMPFEEWASLVRARLPR